MGIKQIIIKNSVQIWAISKLNLKIGLRFKLAFVMSFINPLISILFPLFLMSFIFSSNILGQGISIGVFKAENYISLILLGACGGLAGGFFGIFDARFRNEKHLRTLPALIIAPFNRFNLLLGIFFTNLVMILLPFSVIFIINLILSPVKPSIGSIFFIILIFFFYALTQAGIGLILGALAISKQNWRTLFTLGYRMVSLFNCVTFPKEIFPEFLHPIIVLNPFYHFFEVSRIIWVFDDIFYQGNGIHFLIILICVVLAPIIGIYLFNKIYNKFGIEGI